jgi:hypothetical protein
MKKNLTEPEVTGQEIVARRAYELCCSPGCEHGRDVEDWLTAERLLREESGNSTQPAGGPKPTKGKA